MGTTGAGSLSVDGGSTVSSSRLDVGNETSGNGLITVTGVGSQMSTNIGVVGNFRNTNIGNQGTGRLEVLGGASFISGTNESACVLNCRFNVSNGAGSNGTFLVSGAGSTLDAVGQVRVGYAAFLTLANDGLDYGIAGGASTGRMDILQGGVVNSNTGQIGGIFMNASRTGSESATGTVVIDGAGSQWNLRRDAAQTGALALLQMGSNPNASGSLTISNGGLMRLNGGVTADASGINMGTTQGTAAQGVNTSITVTGLGSAIRYENSSGFFNVGRGNSAQGTLNVQAGGVVSGAANGDLVFMQVGRGGGSGTLNIEGTGSLVRLAGADATGGGAYLHIGRHDVTAGQGVLNISNGGRLEIDTATTTSGNLSAQPGFMIGRGPASQGTATVSGAGSVLSVSAGTPVAPYIAIGRDGAVGTLTISAGGKVLVDAQHLSAPNTGAVYAPGEASFFDIGRRNTGTTDGLATTGTVTVTGAGSELRMSGPSDRLIQVGLVGTAADPNVGSLGTATGTLNILNGGKVTTTALLAGTNAGAHGNVVMNGGELRLEGQRDGGPQPLPAGAGLGLGRQGGSAMMTMSNGSSLIIDTTAPGAGIAIGGGATTPGGTGTLLIQGGSTVSVNGPGAAVSVGRLGSATTAGTGTLVLSGSGSSMSVSGSDAKVLVGRGANTLGTASVGLGSSMTSSDLIGIAHDGTSSTAGTGVLVVNGTATASRLIVGTNGFLGGSGVINANVTNLGVINAGNSPGRLTINGDFDSSQGEIVLEVEDLGNGQWAYDEIVLGNPAALNVSGARIRFDFLGDADPTAFKDSGLFDLGSFFKEFDVSGGVVDLSPSFDSLFGQTQWSASSTRYTFNNFVFNPTTGATFTALPISAPASLALALAALVLLGLQRRAQS